MPTIQNTMEWEPVAVPLTSGVDLNTRARLVDPTKLLVAENVHFPRLGGPQKRNGHVVYQIEDSNISRPNGAAPAGQLFGWGRYSESDVNKLDPVTDATAESEWPEANDIVSVAVRGDERIAHDGFRLYSQVADGFKRIAGTFYRPEYISSPVAKVQNSQVGSNLADNGVIRVVAFVDLEANRLKIHCYDSDTGALRFEGTGIHTDPAYTAVIPMGAFIHVYISDATNAETYLYVIHQNDTVFDNTTAITLTQTNVSTEFDVWKINDNLALFASINNANAIKLTYLNANGSTNSAYFGGGFTPAVSGTPNKVGVAVHPLTSEICLIWNDTGTNTQLARIYTPTGSNVTVVLSVSAYANNGRVTVTPSYLKTLGGYGAFYCYADRTTAGSIVTLVKHVSGSGQVDLATRVNVRIRGKAFTVGNAPFVLVSFNTTLQNTYILLDKALNPVGKFEPGTAYMEDNNIYFNEHSGIYHFALMYRIRVVDVDGVFHESSTKWGRLEFSKRTIPVEAGRCSYFPGAQLWQYDGQRTVEAGFHFYEELAVGDFAKSNGAGALTNNGIYRYRIYQCHKNAQGEEVRGPAILGPEITLGAADDTVVITGSCLPTCRESSYFLVYRNENNGLLWYLVSDRDPSSANCPKNSKTTNTWTFTDLISDVTLISREPDPANADGYLPGFSPPANTGVAYGRDRLWVFGGELAPGEVLPGRSFNTAEAPTFTLAFSTVIDRDSSPVTAIGFLSNYAVVFKRDRIYLLPGELPTNTSGLGSLAAELAYSELGAVGMEGVYRLTTGLTFQAPGGMRQLTANTTVQNIGSSVDLVVEQIVGTAVNLVDRSVRFYQTGTPVVLDYESGEWSTWTLTAAAGTTDSSGIPFVAVGSALWVESADTHLDGDTTFTYRIRTPWLGKQLGGFQRVRRVAVLGELYDETPRPTITVNIYIDERPEIVESFSWNPDNDLNTALWGGANWGDALWGDTSAGTIDQLHDNAWRFRRRLSRQKCSCISIELVYTGNQLGPIPTAILLELGSKSGLDRMGPRTFTTAGRASGGIG